MSPKSADLSLASFFDNFGFWVIAEAGGGGGMPPGIGGGGGIGIATRLDIY